VVVVASVVVELEVDDDDDAGAALSPLSPHDDATTANAISRPRTARVDQIRM
jgi:hypothetical protein